MRFLALIITAERRLAAIVALLPTLVFSAALAAVSLVPALFLLATSARGAGLTSGGPQWWMHPARAIEWIWPLPCGPEGNESWFVGPGLRLGFAVSLLAIIVALLAFRRQLDRSRARE